MTKSRWIFLLIGLGLTICLGARAEDGSGAQQPKQVQPEQKAIKHIIYITVGGMSDELLRNAHTPNINGLAASGIKTKAIGVLPAESAPMVVSLLTGADPSIHGFTGTEKKGRTETIPEIIAGYGRSSAVIYPGGMLPDRFFGQARTSIAAVGIKSASNEDFINRAIDIFCKNRPFFVSLNLPGIEEELIREENPGKIAKAVNAIDEQIGRFLAVLSSTGVYNGSMIVVTGNYGKNFLHSGKIVKNTDNLMVPLVMTGPGLKCGAAIPPVKITDIAPTTALLACLHVPPEANGTVLWNALRSGAGFQEENLLLKRIKDLSDENIASAGMIYRLMEEKRLVKVEKENIDREKSKIQGIISTKDARIRSLKRKIRIFEAAWIISLIVLGAGYVAEYFYLRKKFLMF